MLPWAPRLPRGAGGTLGRERAHAGDHAGGDGPPALGALMPRLYEELRAIAQTVFAGERASHTLQPTAVVHEAYLRLAQGRAFDWTDRAQFLAVAATAMRRLLIDHARAQRTRKRGGGAQRVTLDESLVPFERRDLDLLALEGALSELAALHARQHRVVELRFFGGLTIPETAHVLGVGTTTVEDDWAMARAWLMRRLAGAGGGS